MRAAVPCWKNSSKPSNPTATTLETSWTPAIPLTANTAYSWQIVATNAVGTTAGPTWTFTTSPLTVRVTNLVDGETLRYPMVLVAGIFDGAATLNITADPTNAAVSFTKTGNRFRCLVDLQPGTNTLTITDSHGPVTHTLVYLPATSTQYRYKIWYAVPSDEANNPVDPNYYVHFGLLSKLYQSWMAEDQLRAGNGRLTFYPEMDASNNVNVGKLVLSQTRAQAEAIGGGGMFSQTFSQLPSAYKDGFHKNVVFTSVAFAALSSGDLAYVGAYQNIFPNRAEDMMAALLSTTVYGSDNLNFARYAGVTLHEVCHGIHSIWHDFSPNNIMGGYYDISRYFTLTISAVNNTPHNEANAATLGNQRSLAAWNRYLMSADPRTYVNTTLTLGTGPEYLSAASINPMAVFQYYVPNSSTDRFTNLWSLGATTFRKHLASAVTELNNTNFNIMAVDTEGNMRFSGVTASTLPVLPASDTFSVSSVATTYVPPTGVLANDPNPSNLPLTALLATNTQHGTLVLNADGSFTYTPTLGFPGTDSFWYAVDDGLSSDQQARVTLNGPLWPPVFPAGPSPADGATGVGTNTSLTWAAGATATGHRVFLWPISQSKPGTPTANLAAGIFTPSNGLLAGTTYHWQVVSTNSAGPTDGPVWTFSTQPNLTPFSVSGVSLPGGVPTFTIPNSVSTSQYTLYYKNNLTDPTWLPLGGSGTALGNGGILTLSDPTVAGSLPTSRFYLVGRNP